MTGQPVPSAAGAIAQASERLIAAGHKLRAMGPERVCRALSASAATLQSPSDPLGRALRMELRGTSGLSPDMLDWCLSTTLGSATESALLAMVGSHANARGGPPRELAAVVLAGNVCTAALRAVGLPLLAGVPVLAKTASHDSSFPRFLASALRGHDPDVAAAFEPVAFHRGDDQARDALLARAQVVSIYGDDTTVADLTRHAPRDARVLAHGHGLSALYIGRECLGTASDVRAAAEQAALDIAAYDQRGCLSPHFVLVERGGAVSARAFAEVLARHALASLETRLSRGALDTLEKAACLQWRAVAAARGELIETPAYAVSIEASLGLRPSPGARHVGVYECAGTAELASLLTPFGEQLKCVGVAGSSDSHARVAAALASPRPPRVCRAGEMQTPPFNADADGLPALEGFFFNA